MSGIYRTKADLDAAFQAGTVNHRDYASLSQYFEPQGATQGAPDVASLATGIPATTAQHAPALEALSKMIASGQCDGKDIAAKLKAGVKPEFLAAHGGMDMGEAIVAAMDAEHQHLHKSPPKIETRAQAVAEIRKFEENKSDMADQVVAQMLRQEHGVWEVL
jgi:hypothetical protein